MGKGVMKSVSDVAEILFGDRSRRSKRHVYELVKNKCLKNDNPAKGVGIAIWISDRQLDQYRAKIK